MLVLAAGMAPRPSFQTSAATVLGTGAGWRRAGRFRAWRGPIRTPWGLSVTKGV